MISRAKDPMCRTTLQISLPRLTISQPMLFLLFELCLYSSYNLANYVYHTRLFISCWALVIFSSGLVFKGTFLLQASQGGYGVEFTQAPQSGYSGNYLNQNAHPGYSHMGTTNDIVSQVCSICFLTIMSIGRTC